MNMEWMQLIVSVLAGLATAIPLAIKLVEYVQKAVKEKNWGKVLDMVKQGKHLAFKIPNGKRFVRCDSLGDDYTEAAIIERISGKRIVAPKARAVASSKPNMLIDIQARMQKINSPGFEHWAKIFNLKEMAKTVMYLQENHLTDLGELEKACDAAAQEFNDLGGQIKAAEQRMKDISELQRHIGSVKLV